MYGRFCGVPRARVHVCPNLGWIRDFADPQTVLNPAFNGNFIFPENNPNWPQLNDPAINRAMARGELTVGDQNRADAWGAIDRQVTATGAAIPWLWDRQPNVFSADVRCVPELWNQGHCDFAYTSLKKVAIPAASGGVRRCADAASSGAGIALLFPAPCVLAPLGRTSASRTGVSPPPTSPERSAPGREKPARRRIRQDRGRLRPPPGAVGPRAPRAREPADVRRLLRAAVGRPGAAARRAQRLAGDARADPREPRPRPAADGAVLDVPVAARLPREPRLQLLQPGAGRRAARRPPAGDDLADARRDRHLGARRGAARRRLRRRAAAPGSTS